MKFSAVLAAIAAATVVNAQGYNSTSHATTSAPAMTHAAASIYDSRTVNVTRSSTPATAITSIYTITSSCGSVQIYLPSTRIFPLSGAASGADATRVSATYTGSSTGGAVRTAAAMLAAVAPVVGALVL